MNPQNGYKAGCVAVVLQSQRSWVSGKEPLGSFRPASLAQAAANRGGGGGVEVTPELSSTSPYMLAHKHAHTYTHEHAHARKYTHITYTDIHDKSKC